MPAEEHWVKDEGVEGRWVKDEGVEGRGGQTPVKNGKRKMNKI